MSRTQSLPLLLCLGSTLLVSTVEAATLQHSEPLRGYREAAGNGTQKPSRGERASLTFNAFSRDFVLELEPNGRLGKMQADLNIGNALGAYRGKLAGRPESWVRLVLTPAGPSGLVFDGDTLYGVESGDDRAAATGGGPTMFRLADVYLAPGEIGCAVGDPGPVTGAQAVALITDEFATLAAQGATRNLDLGAVADFEFSQAFGAAANTALLTRFNNVDGIFSEQLGVQITVAQVDIFTTSNDPFTATAASDLLDELADYRGATPAQDAQGLTHLFTGRNLDGSTAGIAFLGSVCSTKRFFDTRSFGSALSEGRRGATIDSLIAAHEIGHNFGAPHDAESGSPCASTPPTFLMAPSVSGTDRFSPCSVTQMQQEIATASCLTPIGAANVAVTLPNPSTNAPVGTTFDYAATVTNLGVDAATGVDFTAATATGLEVIGVSAGAATCSFATTDASCALGTIGGGAARQVALTLRATTVGSLDLTATVTADQDASPADDSDTVTFTAVPVVDLALSAGTSSAATLNGQTTVTATLGNSSDFAAAGASLTATLSAGLRPDQAALGGVACTIAGQTIACAPQSLAAHTTTAIALTVTGIASGAQQISLSATTSEAEATPIDNQLAVTVNVSAPADDGGGGALSWLGVAALLAAFGFRRRTLRAAR